MGIAVDEILGFGSALPTAIQIINGSVLIIQTNERTVPTIIEGCTKFANSLQRILVSDSPSLDNPPASQCAAVGMILVTRARTESNELGRRILHQSDHIRMCDTFDMGCIAFMIICVGTGVQYFIRNT